MKNLVYIFLILILASCGEDEVETNSVSNKYNVSNTESKESLEVELGEDIDKKVGEYENPFFIYGTDFGKFFQTMYTHGKFEDMIKFTSSKSIEQFGEDAILKFYKNELDFGYDIGKYPLSSGTDGDVIFINYEANIMATKKIIRMNVVIENDSCKIVLPNKLKNFPS